MKTFGLNIIFLFVFKCGFAQVLSLQNAINIALKNNFGIQIAKNNQTITAINNNIGIAGGLPIVTSSITDNTQIIGINQKFVDPTKNINVHNVGSNVLTANVTGSMLLYNGLRVVATKKQLEVLQQLNQQQLNANIQNLIASVTLKYYDIIRQQEYLKTLQQSMQISQQKLDLIKLSRQVGLANDADLFQSQLDLNSQLQTTQSQHLVIDQDKTDLLTFLTLKPDSTIEIKDTIVLDKPILLDEVLNKLNTNADIQTLDLQIKSNQWIEKQIAAQRYPSIKLNSGYNLSSTKYAAGSTLLNQNLGPFIGLSFSVPIYNGSVNKRQEEISKINTQNVVLQKNDLFKNYSSDAVKTWQAYNSSSAQLKTEIENNHIAAQLLSLVIKKFQLKQATIIDVKLAQQSFEESGFRLINLNYAAKAAEIELKRIMNNLNF